MVREANGQYDSIRAKSVKRCLFGGSRELQFLNMRKASYSFHRNLIQLHAEKTSPKIYKMVQSLFSDLLSAMQEMKILYILWREIFPVSHWRQSYFHSLVSLQQFILPFDVQSIFSLLVQQRWVSILFSAKYNEGNQLNIQSRKAPSSRMSTKIFRKKFHSQQN